MSTQNDRKEIFALQTQTSFLSDRVQELIGKIAKMEMEQDRFRNKVNLRLTQIYNEQRGNQGTDSQGRTILRRWV